MNDQPKAPQFVTRVTRLTVAPVGEAIFSETATHVQIEDEAAGEFIEVVQSWGNGENEPDHKIRIGTAEWPEIKSAIERLFVVIARGEIK